MSAVFRKTALAAGAIMCLAGQGWARPNLVVSEFSMTPATPVQGESVHVRIGVYNTGDTAAGRYHVEWWPGENFADGAACNWTIERSVPGAGASSIAIIPIIRAGTGASTPARRRM